MLASGPPVESVPGPSRCCCDHSLQTWRSLKHECEHNPLCIVDVLGHPAIQDETQPHPFSIKRRHSYDFEPTQLHPISSKRCSPFVLDGTQLHIKHSLDLDGTQLHIKHSLDLEQTQLHQLNSKQIRSLNLDPFSSSNRSHYLQLMANGLL